MRWCEVEKMAYDFLGDFCCFLFFVVLVFFCYMFEYRRNFVQRFVLALVLKTPFFTTPDVVCLVLCFLSQNGLSQDAGFKDLLGVYMTP